MMRTALITGVAGQDGSYLAELLLEKGYDVHGTVLPAELENPEKLWRLATVQDQLTLHPARIEDFQAVQSIIQQVRPDECYHLAAVSFVSYVFEEEFSVFETNLGGTHNLLAAVKTYVPECRFYFAASSEIFGQPDRAPQDENTPMNPRSIYGITKAAGYQLVKYYRQQHGLFACSGIAYNHESPRREPAYVTRKITMAAARIKLGLQDELVLGNLDAQRDWGYAPDYVRAMWLMLQQEKPEDFVLATGVLHAVRELCEVAFSHLGLNYRDFVRVDSKFFRPDEPVPLIGDPSKAKDEFSWDVDNSFHQFFVLMTENDFNNLKDLA